MLLHSFICDGTMWDGQVPALSESHRVLNLDMRGHGRSGTVEGPVTLDDLIEDVVAVLDDAGVDRATWIGLSIGGMTSLRAALRVPERVAGLVVLDSHAGSESIYRRSRNGALGLGVRLLGFGPFLNPIGRLMFGATSEREKPELVEAWKAGTAGLHIPSILRILTTLKSRDSVLDRLQEIQAPTLVRVGAEDRALPPPCSEQIAAGIPGAEYATIEGAGHLSALEQPEAVNAAILDFLKRRLDR